MTQKTFKKRCRFDCFVRLSPGNVSHFPGQKRTFCYRGDKFTDQEPVMIRNLVRMITKNLQKFDLVELYDNNLPPDSPARIILKISGGIIEKNRLPYYKRDLVQLVIPEPFKTLINENKTHQG